MKHLRRFNESLDQDGLKELQEFCEDNLVYLLDDGFRIDVKNGRVGSIVGGDVYTCIKIKSPSSSYLFSWDQIKDYFIPFIQRLSKSYNLKDGVMWWTSATINKGRPEVSPSGIFFDYMKPISIVCANRNNKWFNIPSQKELDCFTPEVSDILNDDINNKKLHYGWNCMKYLYEINIIIDND